MNKEYHLFRLFTILVIIASVFSLYDRVKSVRGNSSTNNQQDLGQDKELSSLIERGREESAKLQRGESAAGQAESLDRKVLDKGTIRVSVRVRSAFVPEGNLGRPTAIRAQRYVISEMQEQVLNEISGYDPSSVKRFSTIPYVTVTVNRIGLESLRASANVLGIEEEVYLKPSLLQSVSVVGAKAAWAEGRTGKGQVIAILDTGVEKNHPMLAGKIVSEACYSTNLPPFIESVCPGGVSESTSVNSGVNCSAIELGCGHGTHVAGIAAGNSSVLSGVAKEASVVSIQVFSKSYDRNACDGSPSCLLTSGDNIIDGLERVLELSKSLPIASVNLSLGGGFYAGNCDALYPQMKSAIDNLRSVGIATIAATGNNDFKDGIAMPACISSAISVGATDSRLNVTEKVTKFSNSSAMVDLLAPGEGIVSAVPGGDYAAARGTSMAAPHVAGAWALVKDRYPRAGVSVIQNAFKATGDKLTDPGNNITRRRIRVDQAINEIQPDYVGNLEVANCNVLTGWVADRYRPNSTITLRIYDGDNLVEVVRAGLLRPDVAAFLGDNGRHGFSLPTPAAFKDGRPHTLRIRFETSDVVISNGRRTIDCSPDYVGRVDQLDCMTIRGWAADRNRLNSAITVRIYDAEKLVQTVTANQSRPDVGQNLGDNGTHGFNIATPAVFRDGKPHSLRVRFESSNTSLSGGAKSIDCSPVYAGKLEQSDCTTISGWAIDRNRLNSAISVRIYDGDKHIQSVVANNARPDVGAFFNDNGLHGFRIATPAVFKDGKTHTLRVQFESSKTILDSGQKSLKCSK